MTHLAVALSMAAMLAGQQAQTDATGRVTGRVVVAGSTTPVAGAEVTLVPVRRATTTTPPPPMPPGPPPQRITDEDGHFTFERIRLGEYHVSVSKAGFAQELPAFAGGTPPTQPIVVTAGQIVDVGDLVLARGGAIAGRVLDASGEPIVAASVTALRRVQPRSPRATGPPFIPIGGSAQTNDLGEFRLFGVAPGEYAIAAAPPRSQSGLTSATATSVQTTTYYPGIINPLDASIVTVTAGDTVNGIEVRLATAMAFLVSGVVVNESGAPVDGAMVRLMPVGRPGMFDDFRTSVRTASDGRFTIGGVVAGTYRAFASVPVTTWSSGDGAGGVVIGGTVSGFVGGSPAAPADVVVGSENVSGVRIVIQAR